MTARGRIDELEGGSLVSVQMEIAPWRWFVVAIVITYGLALGAAIVVYGALPPVDSLVGAGFIAILAITVGMVAPRIDNSRRDDLDAFLREVLQATGPRARSLVTDK